mmetsp:Transcript_1960/g.4579  ORF Transcript_1960/g.4579 Transcript_1960/m.4579 type:complete len:84 (+) Transcript_1960:7-258(+)
MCDDGVLDSQRIACWVWPTTAHGFRRVLYKTNENPEELVHHGQPGTSTVTTLAPPTQRLMRFSGQLVCLRQRLNGRREMRCCL